MTLFFYWHYRFSFFRFFFSPAGSLCFLKLTFCFSLEHHLCPQEANVRQKLLELQISNCSPLKQFPHRCHGNWFFSFFFKETLLTPLHPALKIPCLFSLQASASCHKLYRFTKDQRFSELFFHLFQNVIETMLSWWLRVLSRIQVDNINQTECLTTLLLPRNRASWIHTAHWKNKCHFKWQTLKKKKKSLISGYGDKILLLL